MKKIILTLLILLTSFSLVACDLDSIFNYQPNDDKTEDKDDEKPVVPDDEDEDEEDNEDKEDNTENNNNTNNGIEYIKYEDQLYNEFFDINSTIEIKIDIAESELALIQSDYEHYSSFGSKSPIYRMADVTFIVNGREYFYEEVGIRMKGNTSRRNFYNANDGVYDMIHYKLSFSQTFDKDIYDNPKQWNKEDRDIRKARTFASMEKLDLKWNKSEDETYSREYWTMQMFEEFGVLAMKVTPANIKLKYRDNFENMGVYFAFETIDELFLEKRLGEKHLGGDLYKVGWTNYGGELTMRTIDQIGVEDEDLGYKPIYDLKTNKKKSDFSSLTNLITLLADNNSDLSTVVNLDYYINFEAVSYLMGNPDDMRNNYNNYYIYFLNDTNQAIIIPYDYDRVLGITHEWNPTGNAMTSYSPYTKRTTNGDMNNHQVNPLVLRTIARGGDMELILKYRELIIAGQNSKYFNINEFYVVYNINKAKYENVTESSISRLNNKNVGFSKTGRSNMSISEYLNRKSNTIDNLIDNYQ